MTTNYRPPYESLDWALYSRPSCYASNRRIRRHDSTPLSAPQQLPWQHRWRPVMLHCNLAGAPTTATTLNCNLAGAPTATTAIHCNLAGAPTTTKTLHCNLAGAPMTTATLHCSFNDASLLPRRSFNDRRGAPLQLRGASLQPCQRFNAAPTTRQHRHSGTPPPHTMGAGEASLQHNSTATGCCDESHGGDRDAATQLAVATELWPPDVAMFLSSASHCSMCGEWTPTSDTVVVCSSGGHYHEAPRDLAPPPTTCAPSPPPQLRPLVEWQPSQRSGAPCSSSSLPTGGGRGEGQRWMRSGREESKAAGGIGREGIGCPEEEEDLVQEKDKVEGRCIVSTEHVSIYRGDLQKREISRLKQSVFPWKLVLGYKNCTYPASILPYK